MTATPEPDFKVILSADIAGSTALYEQLGDVAVLAVMGVVDLATGPALRQEIEGLIGEAPMSLIIDLSKVTFISSTCLAILAATKERLDNVAGFAVVANNPATTRPIQLTGLDQLFSMYATLQDALDGLGTAQPNR